MPSATSAVIGTLGAIKINGIGSAIGKTGTGLIRSVGVMMTGSF